MSSVLCIVSSLLLSGCALGDNPVAPTLTPLRDTFARVSPAVAVVHTQQRELLPLAGSGASTYVAVPGLGSGVLVEVDDRHLVFTASHVIQTADQVFVQFDDKKPMPARIIASSPGADVALLELEKAPRGVTPLKIADSDQVAVGDQVFIVGAPYGLSHTLTVGYLGARRKSEQMLEGMAALELFQTDAAINTGNSGGPMFNMDGEVIGIVSHILTRSGGFEGAGFAITSNLAKQLLLEQPGFWSGVDARLVGGDVAHILNLPQAAGILVQRVAAKSPAANMGIKAGSIEAVIAGEKVLLGGDVVLAIAGVRVDGTLETHQKIRQAMSLLKPEQSVAVEIMRGGKVLKIEKKLADVL